MEDQREIYGDGKTFLDYKRIRNLVLESTKNG